MKKHEVEVGGTYTAKVGGRQTEVRIDREHPRGGWDATAVATNKKVRIKDARHLRPAAATAEAKDVQPAKAGPKAGKRRATAPKAEHAAPACPEAAAAKPLPAEATSEVTGGEAAVPRPEPEAKAAGKARAENAAKGPKAMSCLDAAAEVLKANGTPMRCKEMVEQMAEKGLWTTTAPTPAATLYSAILREVGKKGEQARFRKTDRGHFALNA